MTGALPSVDPVEVRRALELLHPEGETFETRILEVKDATWNGHRDTRSYPTGFGYFRDPGRAAQELSRVLGSARFLGIYTTLNPVRPELFSRAADELRPAGKKDSTTSDADVPRRRWLLVDLDFKRPTGISTTDAEHEAALALARRIAQEMTTRHGWPPPVIADSGNGAHLLWQVSLPGDDGGLVKRVLARLQKDFAADGVDVDQTVFNPARITKLYGTLAAKGSNTPERPHRMSRILEIPEDLRPVPSVLLEDYAGPVETATPPPPGQGTTSGWSVDEWVSKHLPEAKDAAPHAGGRKWILDPCPFDENHRGTSSALFQLSGGGLAFKCQHNGCSGRTWTDLRTLREGPRRTTPPPAEPQPEAASQPEPWPDPIPFSSPVDLPEFPIEALPPELANFATEAAASVDLAPEAAAVLALACISAAAARNFTVAVGDTHEEPVNIYTALVMEPGERKTEIFKRATAPLEEIQQELSEAMAPQIARAQAKRAIQDQRLAELTKRAAKEDDSRERARLEDEAGQLAGELVDVPAAPDLIVADITMEALVTAMDQQGGRIALLDPDSGLFEIAAGRYSGQPNFEALLKAHAGDTIRVKRSPRRDHIERPALTVGVCIQPRVAESLGQVPAFRGRGLLGRFIWVTPDSRVGSRIYKNRAMNPLATRAYSAAVKTVFHLPKPPDDKPHRLILTGRALEEWATFANKTERQQAEGGRLCGIRDWASKAAGLAARLAGLLHVVRYRDSHPAGFEIGLEDVVSGLALADWATEHALFAYGLMAADEKIGLARRLLRWIERTKDDPGIFKPSGETLAFSLRDCHRRHQSFGRAEDILPALEILESRSYIRRLPDPPKTSPGRPPSPRFEISPLSDTNDGSDEKPARARQETGFVNNVISVSKESFS